MCIFNEKCFNVSMFLQQINLFKHTYHLKATPGFLYGSSSVSQVEQGYCNVCRTIVIILVIIILRWSIRATTSAQSPQRDLPRFVDQFKEWQHAAESCVFPRMGAGGATLKMTLRFFLRSCGTISKPEAAEASQFRVWIRVWWHITSLDH